MGMAITSMVRAYHMPHPRHPWAAEKAPLLITEFLVALPSVYRRLPPAHRFLPLISEWQRFGHQVEAEQREGHLGGAVADHVPIAGEAEFARQHSVRVGQGDGEGPDWAG